MLTVQALCAALFVLIHLFAGELQFLEGRPRSRWLSVAGGISVAYVFIEMFPGLARAQADISAGRELVPFVEHHAYLMALFGLTLFYGLEGVVSASQRPAGGAPAAADQETTASDGVFWLHMSSFAVYNALVGYLLVHREDQGLRPLIFYVIALAVHFVVTDHGLRRAHQATYARLGRWVLSLAILIGWGIGLSTTISLAATGALVAFLAGGVVLNVLKEELPAERESRFLPFVLGAAGYAVLLLLK